MSNLSLPSMAGGASLRADHMQFGHSQMAIDSAAHGPAETSSTTTQKRKRNLPGNPDPEAEVIALSPRTLMASKRFICEVCNKGFQRDQNLQLHRRGHNLPWKLRQRTSKEMTKRVYICPEPSCVHNNPTRALGDLTGIKKHYCRKHGEKKWKCNRCAKRYAVQSDWKAHAKTCGTREYRCDCGTLFSRRDSFITHRAFCDALAEETVRVSNGHLLHHKSPLLFSTTGLSNATQLAVAMNMRLPPPPSFPHYLSHSAPSSSSASAGGSSFHGQIAFASQKQKHELFEEPLIQVTKWPYHQDNNNDNHNNSLLGSSNELMMSGNSIQPKLSPARVAARGGGGFSQISQTSFPNYPSDEREPRTMPGFINPSAVSFNSGDYHGGQLFHEGGPLAVMFGSGVNSSSSMQGQLSDVGQEICWPYDRSFPLSANGSSSTSTLNPMQNSKTHAATSLQSSLYYSDGSYAAAIDQATHMQADTNCNGFSVTSPLLKGFGMPTPPPFGLSDIFSKSNLKPPLLESTSSSTYMGKTSSTGLHEGIHSLSTLHSHLLSSNPTQLSQTAELPSHRYNLQSMNDQDCSWKKHSMANLSVFQPPTSSSCSPSIPNSIAQSDQKVLTRDFLGMGRPSHVALNTLNPGALGAGRSGGATFRLSEFGNINAISSSTSTATASITHEIEAKPSHHHNH